MFDFFRKRKAKKMKDELTLVQEQLSLPHVQAYLAQHPEELEEIESKVASIQSKMAVKSTFQA